MGYYTAYYLTATYESNDGVFPEKLEAEIERMNVFSEKDFDYAPNVKAWYAPEEKWYDCEIDMIKLSKRFPDVFFELSGDGEESDDFWKAYFKNGMEQFAPGEITYEPFSPDKLKASKADVNWDGRYSYES